MNTSFKIYFPDKELEKKVVVKGNFSAYQWRQLKDKVVENSKKADFKQYKRELKESDDFILKFIDLPKDLPFPVESIWNNRIYNYLINSINSYNEKNQDKQIKNLKFHIEKVDKLPKWDPPKYDIYLKNTLESTWKNEQDKIIEELTNFELNNGQTVFLRNNFSNSQNPDIEEIKNKGIICNLCLSSDFLGNRYVCLNCNNYNLCQECYNLGQHEQKHNFILFKKPTKEIDINKYDCKLNVSNNIFFNKFKPFEIDVMVGNTGLKTLENCFISYIMFNENHLWCEKCVLKSEVQKNDSVEIKLQINLPNENKDKIGIFEGQFRMFNSEGIPFGDILIIKVQNNKA